MKALIPVWTLFFFLTGITVLDVVTSRPLQARTPIATPGGVVVNPGLPKNAHDDVLGELSELDGLEAYKCFTTTKESECSDCYSEFGCNLCCKRIHGAGTPAAGNCMVAVCVGNFDLE